METVKINIVPKGAVKAAHASQGDAPRVVRFELFDELLPYTLDGSEDITLKVVRPDTEEIVSSVTNTEEAYIDVSFTSEMTALRGVANCEIKISKNGAEIGSHNFDLNIERDAYGEDITVETAQGVIATFTTGVIDNLVGLKTTFEPKQDLHGYPSPWIDSNVVNKTPYLSRALAGTASRIGNYEFNKLVGGTYAFNQLVDVQPQTAVKQGLSVQMDNDGVISVSGVSTAGYSNITKDINIQDNHKYYTAITVISNPNNITLYWSPLNANLAPQSSAHASIGSASRIFTVISHTGINTGIGGFNANTDFTGFKLKLVCIDLTQMLGSTIADYIYSLETAQAGAGISFFKAFFDKDYCPYNAGELMSVKTSSHVTKDANNNVISNIALDPDLELRGIPKLDENNNLYYDGDTYESNGDVTRRFNKFTITSEMVTLVTDEYTTLRYANVNVPVGALRSLQKMAFNSKFGVGQSGYPFDNTNNIGKLVVNAINSSFWFGFPKDVTLAQAQAALVDTITLYQLATPTTESADPFTDPQEIDASGSEEFIDARAVSIPVGHESYYANICEIEGIDEINLSHTGINLFDKDNASVVTGYISASSFSDSNAKAKTICIPIKPSNTYTVSKTAGARFALAVSSVAATNGATYTTRQQDNTASHITITAGANDYYLWAWIYLEDTDTGSLEDMLGSVQIEYGDQASEYKAYTGESVTVEIGQEVYGGYYDKDLGIVLTWSRDTIKDTPLSAGSFEGVNFFIYNQALKKIGNFNIKSDVFKTSDQNYVPNMPNNSILAGSSNTYIYIRADSFTTVEALKSAVGEFHIYYELETPIIIPADAVNFETVKGVNNVWSDTNGETEVKFYVKEA